VAKYRIARIAALVVPLILATGATAAAQTSYPPETLSTTIVACGEGEIVVSVEGAKPNSQITISFDFQNIPDTQYQANADAIGFFNGLYPLPTTAETGAVFTVTITGLDYDPNNPNGVPFQSVLQIDREECPDLPSTGSEPAPVGKIALAVTLAGALLVVVAVRRRPREEERVTAPRP